MPGTLTVKITKYQENVVAASCSNILPKIGELRNFALKSALFVRFKKITPQMLLYGLVCSVCFSEKSCRAIALAFGITCNVDVTRQAVWKKLSNPAIILFLKLSIEFSINQSLTDDPLLSKVRKAKSVLKHVKRILVGDASTLCVHPSLYKAFPGSKNQTNVKKAHLKLQVIFDLLTGRPVHFTIDPYKRSDSKAAFDFLPFIQAGDLLLRDLGYYSMECFKTIVAARAFFISRLKSSTLLYDEEGNKIDLPDYLERHLPKQGMELVMPVLLSKNSKVPCQLVAIRVPDEVADRRRQKLKERAKEQSFSQPCKETLARQNWTLLITNLSAEEIHSEEVKDLYLLRWRIELIFKACKSHSGLEKLAQHKTNEYHAKALIMAWFLMMVMLADKGAFSMARLREVSCPQSHEPLGCELEVHNLSLFKTLEKLILTLGFYIEFTACAMNPITHVERILKYSEIHNKTEQIKSRRSLSGVLEDTLKTNGLSDLTEIELCLS